MTQVRSLTPAFGWLFAHRIVIIFHRVLHDWFWYFQLLARINEIMTTNIPGQVITVADHIVCGSPLRGYRRNHWTFWMSFCSLFFVMD